MKAWHKLLPILLLAAVLRLWHLGDMPPGLYHDEAYNGLDAIALVQGRDFPIFHEAWEQYAPQSSTDKSTRFPVFFEGNFGREPVHVYLMALSVKLFGATPAALRLVPALAGIIGTWTTWLVATQFVKDENKENKRTHHMMPLCAAFTFAILFPTIHFSRFAIRAMLFVPVETAAIWFYLRADSRHRTRYMLCGICVGLGLYVYAAGRLFPLLFVMITLWHIIRTRRLNWAMITPLCMIGITAIIIALPLLHYFVQNPFFFSARMAYVATHGAGTIADQPGLTWLLNVGRVIRGLFWQGETHLRHNLPGRPYLDPIQAIFFTFGLFLTIWGGRIRTKRQRHKGFSLRDFVPLCENRSFLLIWLFVMLLPTILSGDAPHFGRMTGAAPPIAILVAIGAQYFSRKINTPFILQPSYFILSLCLVIYAYFFVYAQHPLLPTGVYPTDDGFHAPDWALGEMVRENAADTTFYLTPTQPEMATILFALDEERDALRSFAGGALPLGVPGRDLIYLVRPSATDTVAKIRDRWGDAITVTQDEHLVEMRVAADDVTVPSNPNQSNPNQSFNEAMSLRSLATHIEGNQLIVTLIWEAHTPVEDALTAFVHLIDATDPDGAILAQHDHPPSYPTGEWRPGEWVVDRFVLSNLPDMSGVKPCEGLDPSQGCVTIDDQTWQLRTGWYNSTTFDSYGDTILLP